MVDLHQYPPAWGLPSLSPFCTKVELYLRRNKIPYRVVKELNPARGPKGKMPFIVDNGQAIPDSTMILLHLAKTRGIPEPADPVLRAQSLAFQRLVEENLYWVLLYCRWIDPAGWAVAKKEFTKVFPPLVGEPVLYFIRSKLIRQGKAQGIARHTREEVYEIGRRDIEALSRQLGDRRYFLGSEWSALDATVYSFLITILRQPIDGPLKAAVRSHANLVHYCDREEKENFPELT